MLSIATTHAGFANGAFALAEALITPCKGPMPHIHRNEDQLFIILEGEVTMLVGNVR